MWPICMSMDLPKWRSSHIHDTMKLSINAPCNFICWIRLENIPPQLRMDPKKSLHWVYLFDHNKLRYIGPDTCPTFGKDALEHVWTCRFVVFQGKAPRACARVLSMCRCDLWESTISSLAIQCPVLSGWQLMDFVSTSSLLVFLWWSWDVLSPDLQTWS